MPEDKKADDKMDVDAAPAAAKEPEPPADPVATLKTGAAAPSAAGARGVGRETCSLGARTCNTRVRDVVTASVRAAALSPALPFSRSPHPLALWRLADFKAALTAVERFVATREPRFVQAALGIAGKVRALEAKEGCKGKGAAVLSAVMATNLPPAHPLREALTSALAPLVTPLDAASSDEDKKEKPRPLSPEAEVLLSLLVLILVIDAKKKEEGCALADTLYERLSAWNRRTLDPFAER
eukprot:2166904-Prymnesium_polylepis.1